MIHFNGLNRCIVVPLSKLFFLKSPGLDQEGSAYGDETVRYFKFQKWNIESKKKKKRRKERM